MFIVEVLLSVKVDLNNWPLTYIEEDSEYSVLTPIFMILGWDIKLTDNAPEEEEVKDNWKKRLRYVHKCKEAAWRIWVHKYLATLRERHNLNHKEKPVKIDINNVVMIKWDEKNRGKWKIGIIQNIFMGKDNTIRSIKIRTEKDQFSWCIQWSYTVTQSQLPEQCRNLKVTYNNLMNYV